MALTQVIKAAYKNMSHEWVHHKEHKHKPPPGEDAMDVNDVGTSTSESEVDPNYPKTDQHAGLGKDHDSDGVSGGSRGSGGSDAGDGGGEVDGSNGGSSGHTSGLDSDEVVSENDWEGESDVFADLQVSQYRVSFARWPRATHYLLNLSYLMLAVNTTLRSVTL